MTACIESGSHPRGFSNGISGTALRPLFTFNPKPAWCITHQAVHVNDLQVIHPPSIICGVCIQVVHQLVEGSLNLMATGRSWLYRVDCPACSCVFMWLLAAKPQIQAAKTYSSSVSGVEAPDSDSDHFPMLIPPCRQVNWTSPPVSLHIK